MYHNAIVIPNTDRRFDCKNNNWQINWQQYTIDSWAETTETQALGASTNTTTTKAFGRRNAVALMNNQPAC